MIIADIFNNPEDCVLETIKLLDNEKSKH